MRSVHPGEWTWKDANLDRLKFTRNYLWWYRQSREKKPRTGLFRLHTHVLIFHELYPRETWTLHACIAVRWVLINGWPRKKHVWIFICYIFVQVAIMVFGEALVLAFLATAVALFGVSVHSIFTSKHNSLMELRKLEDQMMEKYGWNPSMPYNAYN